jgi:hypothetical protein
MGLAFTLVAKCYATLKYIEKDKKEPIAHLQCPKKTRKRMFQIPLIPLIGVNLVATSS